MQKVLVVEDHEPEMRLMVWHLTDDGSRVHVSSTIGEVIADIEKFAPDTVVFNSRMLGQAKAACIELIRALSPHVRIIDVALPGAVGEKRLVDITQGNEGDPRRDKVDDENLNAPGLIYMVNHRRAAG